MRVHGSGPGAVHIVGPDLALFAEIRRKRGPHMGPVPAHELLQGGGEVNTELRVRI